LVNGLVNLNPKLEISVILQGSVAGVNGFQDFAAKQLANQFL
jgi:hypothetical protein